MWWPWLRQHLCCQSYWRRWVMFRFEWRILLSRSRLFKEHTTAFSRWTNLYKEFLLFFMKTLNWNLSKKNSENSNKVGLRPFQPKVSTFGFKLKRKKFFVEALHLPPDFEETKTTEKSCSTGPCFDVGGSSSGSGGCCSTTSSSSSGIDF